MSDIRKSSQLSIAKRNEVRNLINTSKKKKVWRRAFQNADREFCSQFLKEFNDQAHRTGNVVRGKLIISVIPQQLSYMVNIHQLTKQAIGKDSFGEQVYKHQAEMWLQFTLPSEEVFKKPVKQLYATRTVHV